MPPLQVGGVKSEAISYGVRAFGALVTMTNLSYSFRKQRLCRAIQVCKCSEIKFLPDDVRFFYHPTVRG
jgi:hypothetical protein